MLRFSSKQIEYKFSIVKTLCPVKIFEELKSSTYYSSSSKSNYDFVIIASCTEPNFKKIFDIIKESTKYIKLIELKINTNTNTNTNDHNNLLDEIIKLDCVEKLIFHKRYNSNISFESMKNISYVKYNNHYYSNIKFLPSNLKLLEIEINTNSDIFIELPKELNKIKYNYQSTNNAYYIEPYKFNKIFFINTQKNICCENLKNTECLVINSYNPHLDFTNLHSGIKCIYFCSNLCKLTYSLDYLPDSIEELNFLCEFDIDIFNNLPSSIMTINIFINEFFQSEYFPILSTTNVKYINIFIDEFWTISKLNQTNFIKTQYLPKNIKELKIKSNDTLNSKLNSKSNSELKTADIISYYVDLIEKYKNDNLLDFNLIIEI